MSMTHGLLPRNIFKPVYFPQVVTVRGQTIICLGIVPTKHLILTEYIPLIEMLPPMVFPMHLAGPYRIQRIIILEELNLPIVKFSVDWWNTLHQPASISKLSKPNIDISMMIPLIIMTIAFILIGVLIAIIRIKTEINKRKHNY